MTNKRALITGITGQDGSYLAELLLSKGYEVFGMSRRTSTIRLERIAHIQSKINIVTGDLLDQGVLVNIMRNVRPHEVYNLAAQSHVKTSWEQPVFTGEINGLGVARLLEAIRMVDPETRFYQASSSEMFGNVTTFPQNEKTPFHPRSPYGVSKVYAHWITVNFRESYGMYAVSGICYNHESPRRGNEFVTKKIARSAARIKKGLDHELRLGNLDAARDWGYTPEYVKGMWMMLQQETPKDYVMATGQATTVADFTRWAFEAVDLDFRAYVVQDPRFLRPGDTAKLVGDPQKAKQELGWEARVKAKQLVEIMVAAEMDALGDGLVG